jgi:hypothetical protein
MRVALSGLRFPPWSISLFVFIHAGGLHGAAVPHTVGRIRNSQRNDDLQRTKAQKGKGHQYSRTTFRCEALSPVHSMTR